MNQSMNKTNKPPEIQQMLVISTAHMPLQQSAKDRDAWNLLTYPKLDLADGLIGHFLPICEEMEYPAWCKPIIDFAQKLNCTWIMFDRDADIRPELPTYSKEDNE